MEAFCASEEKIDVFKYIEREKEVSLFYIK